jgi:predicted DCC family thiol-disulfide oxidoreductase YuxK
MAPHPLTAAPLPVLVFDGDCAFCTTSAGVITSTPWA